MEWERAVFSVAIRQNVPKKPWNVHLPCLIHWVGVFVDGAFSTVVVTLQLCFAQIRSVLDLVVTWGTHRN